MPVSDQRRFVVALSFVGANRAFVREVAEALAATYGRKRILFDEFLEHLAARPGGDAYLSSRYRTQAELVVVFLCKRYASSRWTRDEWRHIRQLITDGDGWRIMFVELEPADDLERIGILAGDFAMKRLDRSAAEIAAKIVERVSEPAERRPVARTTEVKSLPPDVARAGGWARLLAEHGCDLVEDSPTSSMRLTAALLRIASADEKRTHADRSGATHAAPLARLERDVIKELDGAAQRMGEHLPPDLCAVLVDALDACSATPALGPGALAFLLAEQLDKQVGDRFIDAFREDRELAPGDPIPLIPPLLEQFEAEVDGEPEPEGSTRYDRVRHLRLAPDEIERLRVRLLWRHRHLEPLDRLGSAAVVVTNRHIDDDFAWDEYKDDGGAWFYGVRARDPARQGARTLRGLAEARAHRASIVLLPELAFTPALRDALVADPALAQLPLVVVGSVHEQVAGRAPGRNVSHVYARGKPIHHHVKVAGARYSRDGSTWKEHLQRDAVTDGFDVLLGSDVALVVLICEDAIEARLVDLVEVLSPTVLLVPAMSDRPELVARLRETVRRLSHELKSFSMVACIGVGDGAWFGVPGRADLAVGVTETPSVVLFHPSGACVSRPIHDTDDGI